MRRIGKHRTNALHAIVRFVFVVSGLRGNDPRHAAGVGSMQGSRDQPAR